MDLFQAFILGVVQGATEYLPVSSSGHLVLVPWLFGFDKGSFIFDILVQLGTLLAVVVYFRADLIAVAAAMVRGLVAKQPLKEPMSRLGWFVGLASVPAAVIGVLFKDDFERTFSSSRAALSFLLLTAFLLVLGEVASRRLRALEDQRDEKALTWLDAVVIGLAQSVALFPGVSRSGSTISAGMLMGLDRAAAAKFSFLMSIPVMVGAGLLAIKDLVENAGALAALGPAIAVGFVTSAVTGFICIHWFMGFLKRQSLLWFAAYCALVGTAGLIYSSVAPAAG